MILVSSDPQNADIFIGGLPTGRRTPQYFEIAAGDHVIRVEKSGFFPQEAAVTVREE